MYWFVRPPYLRYATATLIVVFALWIDLRPVPRETRLVAREDITAGTPLASDLFEPVDMPVGMLPLVLPEGVAAVPIGRGEPLLTGHVSIVTPPPGWWIVRLPMPSGPGPGAELRVILLPLDPSLTPEAVPGVVVEPPTDDRSGFGDPEGSVAIPGDAIERVAAAVSSGRVVVMSR